VVKLRILVTDDDPTNRRLLSAVFEAEGFEVVAVADGAAAIEQIAASAPALALVDVRMPGLSGIETLRKIRELAPHLPVIMLTSHGEIADAVEATRLGAYDFLVRPIPNQKLVLTAKRAMEREGLETEVRDLRRRLSAAGDLVRLMGPSGQVRDVVRMVEEVAPTMLTALILGETGTGKELVARAIHHQSGREKAPFVPLDCGAIPDTLLESELFGHEKGAFSGAERKREGHVQAAEGGTLFLDEIGNLSTTTQAKLLRVLQERRVQPLGSSKAVPVDVRFIAATNENLDQRVAAGDFRQDLYYRLAEFTIRLPPLRERREDVGPLAVRFMEEAGLELRRPVTALSAAAQQLLCGHDWPGNVRELRNVVRQSVLQAQDMIVQADDVRRLMGTAPRNEAGPPPGSEPGVAPRNERAAPGQGASLREISAAASLEAEKGAILEALRAARGNKSEAARMLQTDFKTLHLKMKRYGLQRDD
jgi:DNA-binding NtrC family response regulator